MVLCSGLERPVHNLLLLLLLEDGPAELGLLAVHRVDLLRLRSAAPAFLYALELIQLPDDPLSLLQVRLLALRLLDAPIQWIQSLLEICNRNFVTLAALDESLLVLTAVFEPTGAHLQDGGHRSKFDLLVDGWEVVGYQLVQPAEGLAQLGVEMVFHTVVWPTLHKVYLPASLWAIADHLLPSSPCMRSRDSSSFLLQLVVRFELSRWFWYLIGKLFTSICIVCLFVLLSRIPSTFY